MLGETASNLRKVFEYIHEDTWVVLFDEFDAIGRSRDDATEHGEIKRVVNSFLQMLDNFHGRSLLVAATNFEQALDPALWRRFDEVVRFERPTVGQIEDLMQKRLSPVSNSKVSTKRYISQLEGSTFGDIERITTDVLKGCALDGRTLLQAEDIKRALESHAFRRQIMQSAVPSDTPRIGTPLTGMVNFERIEPLPHIVIEREPRQELIRPRRRGPSRIQPRSDRRQHAERMKDQTAASAAELARLRASFGVAPDRFLVLRLETLDGDQRDTLERLNVAVVEEVAEVRDGTTVHRLLVQFPDSESLTTFTTEYDRYADETTETTALPHAMRRNLFDAIESVSTVTAEERTGRRLQREGPPTDALFYLDVDLWNPGTDNGQRELSNFFRAFVQSRGGRVARDPLITPSLFLVKVEANQTLLDELMQLDVVSLVDLPPIPPPEDAFDLLSQFQPPNPLAPVPANGPLACVVDSGVTAGHPLLRGVVVAEEDFDSGEATAVDLNGHGTQVGGLVVYGDIARRMQGNEWLPQVNLYSAKVLRNDPNAFDPASADAAFPVEERVEDQLKRAIEYFHGEYGCRVFNLSIGHVDRLYEGGRQLPWAELLDELARTLDIVIVVSAGNVGDPDIPAAFNSAQFREHVAGSLKQPQHRLIDPATSALSITVGSGCPPRRPQHVVSVSRHPACSLVGRMSFPVHEVRTWRCRGRKAGGSGAGWELRTRFDCGASSLAEERS